MTGAGRGESQEPAAAALAHIRRAAADQPFVVAQLGQSLDGRIATPSGESRWINGPAALDHVHRLRAAVDAVVVGVGTALADDPLLNVRRVAGRNPARVVIDPNGRLPATARCLDGTDGVRRVVVRSAQAMPGTPFRGRVVQGAQSDFGAEIIELDPQDGQLPPAAIVAALFARGLRKLLIEGGSGTVSSFIAAGTVDRLHVLVAPVILGSGKTGLSLPPLLRLADAIRPATDVHILDGGDVLFDCNLKGAAKGG